MSKTITTLISNMNSVIIQPILYLLASFSVVIFIWGLVQFILKAGTDRTEGKAHILWGLIGLLIMVSAITIIKITLNTFSIDETPINNVFN